MATMYYVIADDSDNSMIGSASTLEEAKEIITEDASQFADPDCSMNYSVIKGECIPYCVLPRFEFDFEEREDQSKLDPAIKAGLFF